jgi:hypothetical protein
VPVRGVQAAVAQRAGDFRRRHTLSTVVQTTGAGPHGAAVGLCECGSGVARCPVGAGSQGGLLRLHGEPRWLSSHGAAGKLPGLPAGRRLLGAGRHCSAVARSST